MASRAGVGELLTRNPPGRSDDHHHQQRRQKTFADHLQNKLGWESVYAYNQETFGPAGTLGRASEREVVLVRDLRAALERLNPELPEAAREQAVEKLTRIDFACSLVPRRIRQEGEGQECSPPGHSRSGGNETRANAGQ